MRRAAEELHLSEAHKRNITGKDIGVAVLDTGLNPHPDFLYPKNRIAGFFDAIYGRQRAYDDSSHGTHVAGILGGSGYMSGGLYTGVAPGCRLIPIKILNRFGEGDMKSVIQGIDWVLHKKDHLRIRIVNISIASVSGQRIEEESEFVKKVETLWDEGLVVVASAGNGGPAGQTIGAPGNSRKIITVGCSDEAEAISGRGPTFECVKKPDIVAPGHNIISCGMKRNRGYGYAAKSGTSMSCPMVSGAVALLLERYPNMTNLEVKVRLKNIAVDLGRPHACQGWGMLDILPLI